MTAKLAGVLYTDQALPRSLLGDFARSMSDRGWKVGGLIQEVVRDETGRRLSIDAVALDTGERFQINQPKASKDDKNCSLDSSALSDSSIALRRAIDEQHDLVVIEKFGEQERLGGGLMDDIFAVVGAGIPVLVAVPAYAVDLWNQVCGGLGSLLPWDERAWQRWWSPDHLYDELQFLDNDAIAQRVVVGLNWTLVEGPDGCGLAHTPTKSGQGCYAVPTMAAFSGQPLSKLASHIRSHNPFEAAIAMAAINAGINISTLEGSNENGLDSVDPNSTITVIGRFPGVRDRIPGCRVIELDPREGEYPETATERLVSSSDAVVVTASSLQNHSLPRILAATNPGTEVVMLGPGTCLSTNLFNYGITTLSGMVITDPDKAARTVAEGGAVQALKSCGRYVTLNAT